MTVIERLEMTESLVETFEQRIVQLEEQLGITATSVKRSKPYMDSNPHEPEFPDYERITSANGSGRMGGSNRITGSIVIRSTEGRGFFQSLRNGKARFFPKPNRVKHFNTLSDARLMIESKPRIFKNCEAVTV